LQTAPGSHLQAFGVAEWGLLAATAGIWGSSFLLIAEALESFAPPLVTAGRFGLGLLTLLLFPSARHPIASSDWRTVGLVAVIWMVLPMYLFPIAQQWISSSLAGMINGALPLFASVIAAVLLRKAPGRTQAIGLAIGFAGVAAVSLRGGSDFENGYLGVALLIIAVACYGLGVNLAVPLQQRYGALPLLLRALAIATVLTLPPGIAYLPSAEVSISSLVSLGALGTLGTGIAFVTMTTLVGRAGATRGSVATYFIPLVALLLGVTFRGEAAPLAAIAGIALILLGAYLTSRSEKI
jgi:drug/metabolite transporter (DMT)-like permease